MNDRVNNFDFVRCLAACFVIYGHCQVLDGNPATEIAGVSIQSLGVLIFFALSGFLVTTSIQRHRSVLAFLVKRSLRIFPGLAVVVTVTTYLLGPAMTSLSVHDYFQSPIPQNYMKNIALYVGYMLPGVFDNNTYRIAVNGSLWSLPAEFFCYLIVAASAVLPRRFSGLFLGLAGLIAVSLNLYLYRYSGPHFIFYGTDLFQWAAVAVCFFVSAIYCAFKIPLRPLVGLVVVVALLVLPSFLPAPAASILMWVGLPYVILSLGGLATPILRRWGRFGDFSYGMYLYSFPITQTLVALNHNDIAVLILIPSVTVLSVCCAFLSWHLVEKPVLRFKPKDNNVGLRHWLLTGRKLTAPITEPVNRSAEV